MKTRSGCTDAVATTEYEYEYVIIFADNHLRGRDQDEIDRLSDVSGDEIFRPFAFNQIRLG